MGIKSKEQHHQEDLQRIADFRLLDDEFMTAVFDGRTKEIELVLRIILEIDDLSVLHVQTQKEIKNLQGRSVRFDILATDSKRKFYDIEIQRSDHGAGVKRARFNSSLLDANAIQPGEQHDQLPESYVIFITENDVLGHGCPIYHIERVIQETGDPFGDQEHIVYVNGAYEDDASQIGRLMHDFRSTKAGEMYYGDLADRVRHFKETEEGRSTMCRSIELMRDESRAEGLAEGNLQRAERTFLNMIERGYSKDEAQAVSELTDAEVAKIWKE